MMKREIAQLIDDLACEPMFRRGSHYARLLRTPRWQLYELWASWHMTREQREASDRRQLAYGQGKRPFRNLGTMCTDILHNDGEHSQACTPKADPSNPELRLLRAIFGLCPDCDRSNEEHEAALGGRDDEGACVFRAGAPVTLSPDERAEAHQELLEDRSRDE